jgi:acyl carrier protein
MVEMKELVDILVDLDLVSDWSAFQADKTFRENGIDSLDVMSVFLAVEEQFGFKFSEDEAQGITTTTQLLNAINARG